MTVAIALVLMVGAGSALPAYAVGDAPPVTQPDEVSMLPAEQARVDVLANDSDDHYDLAVCRARAAVPSDPIQAYSGGSYAVVNSGTTLGDFTVEYQACDHSFLSVGELTVHVVAPQPVTVEKVTNGGPGLFRVTNPNPAGLTFEWNRPGRNFYDDPIDGRFDLPAKSTVDFEVGIPTFNWEATDYYDSPNFWGGTVTDALTADRSTSSPARSPARTPARSTFGPRRPAVQKSSGDSSDEPWPADPTTIAPPTTVPDSVDMWAGGYGIFDVVADDTDPQGEPLELCRERTSPPGIGAYQVDEDISVDAIYYGDYASVHDASPGTYSVSFNVCNDARMSPETLTVTVRRAQPMAVRRLPRRPTRARFHNPNTDSISYWVKDRVGNVVVQGQLPPGGTTTVTIPRNRLQWVARIGVDNGDAGKGRIERVTPASPR